MDNINTLIENKSKVADEFNRIARRYDIATAFSQGYSSDLHKSVSRLDLKGNERMADLCCGTGKSTIACLQACPDGHITAIDFSEEMLNVAKSSLGEKYPENRLIFELKDVMDLDYPDNSFDALFMAYGIRNMPDYRRCLDNLFRVLKPGGKIAFHEYALADNIFSKIYWYLLGYLLIIPFSWMLTGSVTIFRYLIKSVIEFPSPDKFRQLLTETGFVAVSSTPLPSWRRPVLHTFIARKPQ